MHHSIGKTQSADWLLLPGRPLSFSHLKYNRHIYSKLGVDDRTAAVTTALEKGIITLDW